jgi:hypothetical protein
MKHDRTPRPLARQEFEAMMRIFDAAVEWMMNELKQNRAPRPRPRASLSTGGDNGPRLNVGDSTSFAV